MNVFYIFEEDDAPVQKLCKLRLLDKISKILIVAVFVDFDLQL